LEAEGFSLAGRLEWNTSREQREPIMKIVLIAIVGLILSGVARAGELSEVAGHYRYEQYVVTLPNGRVLHLKDLGASEAFLDVSETGITLRMTMLAGNAVTQSAKVLEAHFGKSEGYWIAQWPDMKGPVRANITLVGDVLTSDTQFDNRAELQFGSSEHAVLMRVSGK
jgi:hypothetical protein